MQDLLYKRYSTIPQLPAVEFVELAAKAVENKNIEDIRAEWLALYPQMALGYLKMISWEEWRDRRTGVSIDMRPTEVILAEIEALQTEG